MFKKILIALVLIVAIFLVIVALQPADFRVERSATFAAPPAAAFAQVNDFHNWQAWSPWAKLDPACKYTYDGPASGVGASMAWAGNNEVGEGRMTILDSKPNELVRIKLEFLKPFAATNTAEFTFKPSGAGQTDVNWAMFGHNNFVAKGMCLFMSMDKMVGKDFEKGLAQMKAVAESFAVPATAPAPKR
jgi:hypothetical protein